MDAVFGLERASVEVVGGGLELSGRSKLFFYTRQPIKSSHLYCVAFILELYAFYLG